MSTILKALQKLEAEKRAAEPVPLEGSILVESVGPRRRSRRLPLIAAGAAGGVLLAAAVIGGYGWLSAPPPGAEFATGFSPPPAAAPPSPVAAERIDVPAKGSPDRKPQQHSRSAATDRLPRLPAQSAGVSAAIPLPIVGGTAQPTVEQDAAKAGRVTLPGQPRMAPHLAVTEIFPATGGDRQMAVVNGLPVMEGTRVEDSLVKEIRPGEVLFEIDGRSVVVPLRRAD